MPTELTFAGKTILVTGAAKGLGLGIAQQFAAHGGSVLLVDILGGQVMAEAKKISEDFGVRTLGLEADVSLRSDMETVFDHIADFTGRLDVCVANAGIIRSGSILDLTEEDLDAVLNVNVKGVFHTCQLAAGMMRRQVERGQTEGGAIIPISSANAVVAIPQQLAYVTSKGAISQMTKAMALALAEYRIRVNAIGPGSVMSDVLKAVAHDEKARKMILSRTPMGRIGEPSEIGKVAVFLASDYASYMTGQTLYPDGGRLALNYTVPEKA